MGAIARDGRLREGQRILEVNGQSLLGVTHEEAVKALRTAGDRLNLLVCDGYEPSSSTGTKRYSARSKTSFQLDKRFVVSPSNEKPKRVLRFLVKCCIELPFEAQRG